MTLQPGLDSRRPSLLSGSIASARTLPALLAARRLMLVPIVALALWIVLPQLRSSTFGYAADGERVIRMTDFVWLRAFVRAVWSGSLLDGDGSVFTVAAHLRATAAWTGRPTEFSFPFAYSPTMLWVLAPFAWLPERAAYALWVAAGVAALAWVVVRAPLGWPGLLAVLTPVTLSVLVTGQTAFLTTAALFFLMATPAGTRRGLLARTGVLFLLTAKPQLALTAAAAMWAGRERLPVLLAGALALLATAAVVPWLGPGWLGDYLHLVGSYDRVGIDRAFAWSLKAEQMSNLRAALHPDLGLPDDVAVRVSAIAWLASLGATVLAVRRRWVDAALAWPLAVLAFLLFCPHLSPTEEVGLVCVLGAVDTPRAPRVLSFGMAALVPLGLWLSPGLGPVQGMRPSLLFPAKVVLATWVLAVNLPRRRVPG